MAVHLAAADDVFGADYFCVVFSHRVSWLGSGIELLQFLKIFQLIFSLYELLQFDIR